MLNRVGRVYYWHLQQTPIGPLKCRSITHKTVQSTGRTKPSTATSVTNPTSPRTQHRNVEGSPSHPSQGRLLGINSNAKSSRKPPPKTLNFPQLPPNVVDMIDRLFANYSWASMLEYLRSSAVSVQFTDRTKATKLAEALVHTQFPRRAIQVLRIAHKLGCPLKQSAYQCVAYQLAEAKHWHLIQPLVALGKRQTGRTTVRLLNWRIRAAIESSHYQRLANVLDKFELENLKPDRRTYHLLVTGHLRNHDLRRAREYLQKMEAAGTPIDATTHSAIVAVYRSLGSATDVQDHAFGTLGVVSNRTSTVALNSLMQLYIDANSLPGILRVLSHFRQGNTNVFDGLGNYILPQGEKLSLDHHSVAQEDIGTSCQPAQFHVTPDVVTFTILINYMVRRNSLPGALWIFERMLSVGVRPDTAAAAAIIRGYFGAGQNGTAIGIIAAMCRRHGVPHFLFSLLGLTSNSADDKCTLCFSDIPLTAEVFNVLLKSALKTHSLIGVRTVLRIMHACQVKADSQTIEILMRYLDYVKGAPPYDLIRVLRNMTSPIAPPTLGHLHTIMSPILRREKFLMLGSGWDVTAAKFSRHRRDLSRYPEGRISGVASSFDPTAGIEFPPKLSYRVRPVVQSLSSRHIMSNRTTIALRLRHEAVTKSNLIIAKRVFREMLARGMRPTSHHFTALMEGHALAGNMLSAGDAMDSALDVGIRANVIMFTILIVGYARLGNPNRAMQTFRSMIAAGIRPDVPAVDAVASAYFFVGAYRMAKRVLLALWPHVATLPADMQTASLRQHARVLRAQHANQNSGQEKHLSRLEKRALHWEILKLIDAWKKMGRRGRDMAYCQRRPRGGRR
jgi:pentatricopeptide repeat protein